MTPWENTFVRNMIYFALFGTGAYADRRVSLPGRQEPLDMGDLVVDYLRRGHMHFEKRHKEYLILETEWFQNFMKYNQPFPEICEYLYKKDKAADSRGAFLDRMLQAMREYTVFDTRQVLSSQEKVLRDYFDILISIVGNILRASQKACRIRHAPFIEASGREVMEEKIRKRDQQTAYLQALMDQNAYLVLAEEFLELGGRTDWDRNTLHEYPVSVLRNRYDLNLLLSEYFNTMGSQTVREWLSHLAGRQWEHESAYYLMHWIRRRENSEIPEPLRQYIIQYYNRNIEEMDFYLEPFACGEDEPNRRGLQIEAMLYFAVHFSLEIPHNKIGELLFLCKYPPEDGCEWLPARYMTEEELRTRILKNLKAGIANETVLSWHILYCMDHPDECYTDVIARVARNQLRKKWVRQIAMTYTCRKMDADMVCDQILPRMQGDMFFFVAEQYRRAGSERLAGMVWRYGEKYATHKLRCDILLIHLQNRRGINSFINHIEKRRQLPAECREYNAVEAIRNINAPELIDELERFFCLGLKDSFRDDPVDGILEASADALIQMGVSSPQMWEAVHQFFERCLAEHGDTAWKREAILDCIRRMSG